MAGTARRFKVDCRNSSVTWQPHRHGEASVNLRHLNSRLLRRNLSGGTDEPVLGEVPRPAVNTSNPASRPDLRLPGASHFEYPHAALRGPHIAKIHTLITLGIGHRTKPLVLYGRRRRPRGFDSRRPLHFPH
jgi:hypothetical protein